MAPGYHTYQQIYDQRGDRYHQAMQEYPLARAREFDRLVATANLPDTARLVLDIPSGGGYLRRHLPDHVRLVSVDPAARFLQAGSHPDEEAALCAKHDDLPMHDNTCDAILSLAGLHHVDDQTAAFREWHRVLKPGGILAVGDAAAASPTSRFLDTVVHAHNSMGHRGTYLTSDIGTMVTACGFTVETVREEAYTWDFPDRAAMVRFCRTLFGMDRNPSDEDLLADIDDTVGYVEDRRGAHLNWSLLFLRAVA